LKAVAEDLGVSRWTLWRAAASDIPGFPAPIKVGQQKYWRKGEVAALQAALTHFKGRCVFDRNRAREKAARGALPWESREIQQTQGESRCTHSARDHFGIAQKT
jgi:predicted DNA-binding transcriptional regulator AlpA